MKIINMRELVLFCEDFPSGYGEAKIIETNQSFFIELYDTGWSECEEKEIKFLKKYKDFCVVDWHPMKVFQFQKYRLNGFGNLKDWCSCYQDNIKTGYTFTMTRDDF